MVKPDRLLRFVERLQLIAFEGSDQTSRRVRDRGQMAKELGGWVGP